MSTGNGPYLEHLRGELTAVLDDVTPSAAPMAAVKRRGKAIRNRRRIGVAAGLGVAIVAVALGPGLLRHYGAAGPISSQRQNPEVTVGIVGHGAPAGLIAQGAIDGKRWRVTLTKQGRFLCVGTSGDLPRAGCRRPSDYWAAWPATLNGVGGGAVNALYGVVAAQVRRVSVVLSDGVVLNLRSVGFDGRRWIGFELPAQLTVTKVVAYSRSHELAYTIPFTAARGDMPSIESWLRPGERVPRQFTRLIGSGVSAGKKWSVTVHAGPWGQCVVPAIPGNSGSRGCWPATQRKAGVIMGSGDTTTYPWWIIAAARARVSYLVLSMTDGTTRQVPTVQVGKVRLYTIVMISGPRIAHWAAYDASGHRLYGGRGAPSFDR
jgi:hypothetical protein